MSAPLTILQVSDTFWPAVGGLEHTVDALSSELAARGHAVHVATLAGRDLPAEQERNGVAIHRLRGWTHHLERFSEGSHLLHPTAPDPQLRRNLEALIERVRPDIVHVHGWILATVLAADLGHARLVVSLHDYGLVCALKTLVHEGELDAACEGPGYARCLQCASGFYGRVKGAALVTGLAVQKRRLHRVDRFLAVSELVAAKSAHAIEAGRLQVVTPFVSDDLAENLAALPEWAPKPPFAVFAGGAEHKGLSVVLKAHEQMRHDIALVVVAGSEVLVSTSDRVVVRAHVDHRELIALMAAASLVFAPARWPEPFGLVAVEAMSVGTPVVVSDVGAQAEVVGDVGLVCRPDANEVAAAADSVFDDPQVAQRARDLGPARAAAFSASLVVPRYERVYKDLAAATWQA